MRRDGNDQAVVRTYSALVLRRLRKNTTALIGIVIVTVLFSCAVAAPLIAPYGPYTMDLELKYSAPGGRHVLGTDEFGRDVLSRIMFGARAVVGIAVTAMLGATLIGVVVGLWSGFYGGWFDLLLMRIFDIMLAFPSFLLAIALVSLLGPSLFNLVCVIILTRIPRYARLIRGATLSLRDIGYVEAARGLGMSNTRIIFRHILPNCIGPMAVYSSLTLGDSILIVSGLSFLGLGVQPPTPDWGSMLTRGREYMLVAPWLTLWPGFAIFLATMGFNLLGDGLRDALDPRT